MKEINRILYVSDSLKQRFGVTAVITNYLNHFDWKEIQVDLLVFDDSELDVIKSYEALGAKIWFMPRLGLTNLFGFIRFMDDFFSQHHYDIVHSHFYQLDSIVFPIAKRHGVQKCISHSHATKFSDYKIRAIRNRLMSLNIGKVADVCAACSDDAGKMLFGKNYMKNPKRLIVKNGIECRRYVFSERKRLEFRKQYNIADTDILVGHVGSLKPQKNHVFLIDILYELRKIDKRYKLMLVGDGELMLSIRAKVQDLGIEQSVVFLGARNDVPDILNAFDLFVFPSLFEGLGIVVIEAQANGLPCFVATTVPKEADITSVHYLDIKVPASVWAKKIVSVDLQRHPEYNNAIIKIGYDISSAAMELQSFYKNILK